MFFIVLPSVCLSAAFINSDTALIIPTYEDSGELTHPSVIYFTDGWNGYKYWMAMTPYPNADITLENPSIVVSNDGITWIEPEGINNPIFPYSESDNNSDPEIFYDEDTDELWLYNRYTVLERKTSSDGINWSEPVTVLDAVSNLEFLSPSIQKIDNTYYMWTVNIHNPKTPPYELERRSSEDGVSWSDVTTCNITNFLESIGYLIWHVDVVYIDYEYRMVVTAHQYSDLSTNNDLFFATSTNGLSWTFSRFKLLQKTGNSWDAQLYKSSAVYKDGLIELYYSGITSDSLSWTVGRIVDSYEYISKYLNSKILFEGIDIKGINKQ